MRTPIFVAAALALAACGQRHSSAHDKSADDKTAGAACTASADGAVTVENAWVRAQSDASAMSAAYFTICNATLTPVTIEGLSTPAAGIVELHETTRDADGVVRMGTTGPITLAPGEAVTFEPGGKHAMLMSLKGPIAEGAAAALTLELAGGKTVSVEAKAVSATSAAKHEH